MGVTIRSKNFSLDLGYGGFARFRMEVAKQHSLDFGAHYSELLEAPISSKERSEFFEKYDKKTHEMVESGTVSAELAHFCYQPDCEGEIDQKQAKLVYDLIKDCDGNAAYGYAGRVDCARMKGLQQLFSDCAENGKIISWF